MKINPTGLIRLPDIVLCHLKDPLTYEFSGQSSDTLNWPKLFLGITTATDLLTPPRYFVCNSKLANGKIVDCFKKNKKSIEGTFNNGVLISNLNYYDLNGKIIKTIYPYRKKRP